MAAFQRLGPPFQRIIANAACGLALSASSLAQGPPPLGDEFQVNTYTTNDQEAAAVAASASGFVVMWQSPQQDGSSDGVFGRRYDPNGNPAGGEFLVNDHTVNSQISPAVAADAVGNFVAVWSSFAQDGSGRGIFGQRFNAAGNRLGDEFQVNTYTPDRQEYPAIAADAAGNFIVVWESYRQDGSRIGVFGQRYDALGTALGKEFQVNSYTTSDQWSPAVAVDGPGAFIVVWQSYTRDGDDVDVFGQRYGADGTPLDGEFQVNTSTAYPQHSASVAASDSGGFVVVWTSYTDGNYADVLGQRYEGDGNPVGGEFQVNSYTARTQYLAAVTRVPSGDFVVAWSSYPQDGSYPGVFGQRYDDVGDPVGGEFLVNTYTTSRQSSPQVATNARGDFVVVWRSAGQDGSYEGIFGQRFWGSLLFMDGFESGDTSAWDTTLP